MKFELTQSWLQESKITSRPEIAERIIFNPDMTRITNFGKKRTYVEAGFSSIEDHASDAISHANRTQTTENVTSDQQTKPDPQSVQPPPKKKRCSCRNCNIT